MPTTLWTFFGNLGIGFVVATTSAWITVRLSLRKFRSERWWEKKAAAYVEAIEALHSLKRDMDADLQAMHAGASLVTNGFGGFLSERYHDTMLRMYKVADTAPFLLSDQGGRIVAVLVEKLHQVENESRKQGTPPYPLLLLEGSLQAIADCSSELSRIAKKDLEIDQCAYRTQLRPCR